jgi:hypothetical protein
LFKVEESLVTIHRLSIFTQNFSQTIHKNCIRIVTSFCHMGFYTPDKLTTGSIFQSLKIPHNNGDKI